MHRDHFELYSRFSLFLPAFFLGRLEDTGDPPLRPGVAVPSQVITITQDHSATAIKGTSGAGLLVPLTMSPLNGPLVDVLRIFSEYGDSYFNVGWTRTEEEGLAAMLDRFGEKYPQWRSLRDEITGLYMPIVHGEWGLDDETRAGLSRLLGHFVDLPPIADNSESALVRFDGSVEHIVKGWPCIDREYFPCSGVVDDDVLDEARACLSTFSSYLLWENAD